jgi:hypothetical protein
MSTMTRLGILAWWIAFVVLFFVRPLVGVGVLVGACSCLALLALLTKHGCPLKKGEAE